MKNSAMKTLGLSLLLPLLALAACGDTPDARLHDGDIIFHTSRSVQSAAIQKATGSKYSHMGIIFFRGRKPYVFEAARSVQYTPLKEWVARGEGGHYVVKRLRIADATLTPDAVTRLRQTATKYQGKPYDLTFEWSDARIYCSELVWKVFENGLGLRIGRLQKLSDFDLSDPMVKALLRERYGKAVPLEETVISPGEMFLHDGLMVVAEH